jgi:hypothetical protein
MATTVLPPSGIENQMIYLSEDRKFYIYKGTAGVDGDGGWETFLPIKKEYLDETARGELDSNIKRIHGENGQFVGMNSDVYIETDDFIQVTADPSNHRLAIGLTTVPKEKLSTALQEQIDGLVQGITVGSVTTNSAIHLRPTDASELTITANSGTNEIQFGINRVPRTKLTDDVLADIGAAVRSISTGSTSAAAPNIQFTSDASELRVLANAEADTVSFEIVKVPKTKLDTEVQNLLNGAVQSINVLYDEFTGESVQGPAITFQSSNGTVSMVPNPANEFIDFKVHNLSLNELDTSTRDIVNKAIHTVTLVNGNDSVEMRGHELTITQGDEFNITAPNGQTPHLHIELDRVPYAKLEALVQSKLDSSVKSISVNNGVPVVGQSIVIISDPEIFAAGDASTNTIRLGINTIPKHKIDTAVTNKIDTAVQSFILAGNGQTINGPNIRLSSGAGVTFAIDTSTNTLTINGPNKVYTNNVKPPPGGYQGGDLVMVSNGIHSTWWFLVNGEFVQLIPEWADERFQINVQLAQFGGQLDASRISNWTQSNWSETNMFSRNFISNKPSWIKSSQTDISLNSFGGYLDWERIDSKPTSFLANKLHVSIDDFPTTGISMGSVTFRQDKGKAYVYTGSEWKTIESVVSTQILTVANESSLPTTNVVSGQLVFNNGNNRMYVAAVDVCGNVTYGSVGDAFGWLKDNQADVELNAFGGSLMWTKIDPSTIPVHFTTNKFRTGVQRPPVLNSTKGEVFYDTAENAMFTFNGTEWVRQNESVDWMRTSQSAISITGFGGKIEYANLLNAPDISLYTPTSGLVNFIETNQHLFALSEFFGKLPWGSLSDIPSWINVTQGDTALVSFGGNLDASRVANWPASNWSQTDTTQKNYISNKPDWIRQAQVDVSLNGFGGPLSYSRLVDTPSWIKNSQIDVSLNGFGGTIPYNRVQYTPTVLSYFANDASFLQITQVLVDSTLTVTRDISANTLSLAVRDVPWNKLSSIPSSFTSRRIVNDTVLPSAGLSVGDVFYKTDTKEMYVHSGTAWVKMAVHVNWVDASQGNVNVGSFGGNFPSSRVDGRIVDASSAPASNLHDGLIWKNSVNGSFSIYYNGTWYITGTSWLTASQSGVNISGFNNNSGFVDPSGARTAVTSGLVVSDLSGNFPYSRLSSVPANVTELATTSNFLRTANVIGSSGVTVTKDVSASTVTLDVLAVPWSKVTNAPTTYLTQNVKTYPTLGDFSGTPTAGTLVYEQATKHLFFYDGTAWIRVDEYVSWVNPTQSAVTMSSFGGQLPANRVSGNLVTGSSAPSSPHDGMLWWDTSGNAMYAWSPNTWLKISSSWSTAAQSSVLLSQFNNNSGFVDALGARAAVTSGLLVSDLSGNFPYTRISSRPVQLTDLSNNTDFLQIAKLSVDSTLQMTTVDASKTVTLRAGTIPWSNLSNVPATFNAFQMRSGTSFPGSPSAGDVLYRTDLSKLYIYSGATNGWLAVNNEISWLNATQSSVQANAFGGTFPDSRVSDKIVVSTTEPSGTYIGMTWTNPSTKITKFYTTVTNNANVTTKSLLFQSSLYGRNDNYRFGAGAFTISLWFKLSSGTYSSNQTLISQAGSNTTGAQFYVNFASSNKRISVDYYAIGIDSASNLVGDTNWHYFALTYDPSNNYTTKIYLDGSNVGTTTGALNIPNGTTTWYLGSNPSGMSNFLGYVDEFAIHNKALSQSEITALRNGGVPTNLKNQPTGPNLEIYYPFESDGNDTSGRNRNLTFFNGSATYPSVAISSPYSFNVNQWVTLNTPWMATDSQGSVDLSSFSNVNAQYINSAQAVSDVKRDVLVTDLSGNIPYSSIASRPTALSDLTDNTRLLDPSAITTTDYVVNLTRGNKTLQVNLNQIPWSKIDASSIPVYFNTDHVQHGATRPTGGLDAGDVFFDTSESAFYGHNGTTWKKIAYSPAWIDDSQANIGIGSWGGNLSNSRISDQFISSSTQPVQQSTTNNKSLLLNGTTQFVACPGTTAFLTSCSWGAWIKCTTTGNEMTVLYHNASSHSRNLFINSTGKLCFRDQNNTTITSSTTVSDGTWRHVGYTLSSTNVVSLYVNGAFDGSGQFVSMTFSISNVYIGQAGGAVARYSGLIDDIVSFNVTLSAAQMLELYSNGDSYNVLQHSASANLQAWWTFDDYVSGNTTPDRSGFNRSATLSVSTPTMSIDVRTNAKAADISKGMIWLDTTKDTASVYTGTAWASMVPSWAAKKTQVEVNVGSFDNTTAGYINNTQALASVRANVQLNELQSNLSYSRLSGAPTTVSSFTNDSNFLAPADIDVSGTQLTIYRGTKSVKIELQDIPWARVSGKPSFYSTDNVKTGSTLPQDAGNIGEGKLFYQTVEDMLYYHNGTAWVKVGNNIDWLNATQSNVGISSFGGYLPFSKVSEYFVVQASAPNPAYAGMIWKNTTDNNLYIYNGASFVLLRTSWATALQSGVNVSGFTNDASYAPVSTVQTMINAIQISSISGSLSYSQITGRPTQLSDLSNNTIVEISKLTVGDSIQKDVSGTNVTLQVSRVPWSKIDTKPTTTSGAGFLADRVINGTVVPSSGVAGDLYYDINDKQLSVHNGDASNAWIKLGTKLDWTSPSQVSVNLSSFGGQLSGNRVDDKLRVSSTEPSVGLHVGLLWRDTSNNVIKVWDGTTWHLLAPSWVQTLQGSVNISGFNNNAQYVTDATLKSNVLSKVAITDLSGNLSYSSLINKPTQLGDFGNQIGYIRHVDILNQDGDNSLSVVRNDASNTVKLAVNVNGLSIPWSRVTGTPTYVLQSALDKKFGTGSLAQRPTTNVSAGDFFYYVGDVNNVPMLYIHDGSQWVPQSVPDISIYALKTEIPNTATFLSSTTLRRGTVAPTTNMSAGDMFYDTSRNVLSIHNGTVWLDRIPDYTDFVTNGTVDGKIAASMTASLPNLLGATYPNRMDVSANYVAIGRFNQELAAIDASLAAINTHSVSTTELFALLQGYQATLSLTAFQGQLDYTRIANPPSWIRMDASNVNIGLFGGFLDYSKIVNAPQITDFQNDWNQTNSSESNFIRNKPTWITPFQGNIDVSLFGGKVDFMRLGSVPSWIRSSQGSIDINLFGGNLDFNTIAFRPSWIKTTQGEVSLSGFKPDVRLSRIDMSPTLSRHQYGDLIINSIDSELYFHNGSVWKKASGVVQGSGGELNARMSVVYNLSAATDKVTGDMVFDQGSKIAYYHDGTSFIKIGDVKRVNNPTQVDPTVVGTIIYNTYDNSLYYHNNTAWIKLQTTGTVTTKLPLAIPSSPSSGDVYFDGSSVRVYSNNQWVSSQSDSNGQGSVPSWVKATSAEVNLSIFNNDLPKNVRVVSTVSGLPGVSGDFVFDASSSSLFVYNNSQWIRAGSSTTLPTWVRTDASLVNLSSFNNDLSQNALPSWITNDPKSISLSAFSNDLSSTTTDGSFTVMDMPIYLHGNGFSLAGIKGTCSFDPSLEENLFTSYKIVLVNPARNKGVVLKTIHVGEPKLSVLNRPGAYLDVPFYIYGDTVNPLITSVVGSEVTFDGFSLYCLTSKSAVLPTNYTSFSNRILLSNSTPTNSTLDLSAITIDTYGKIMSAAPKLTMDGLVVNNAVIRYYERPELTGFEKVIALSQNGTSWTTGAAIENDDGEILNIPYIVVGDYSMWCIAYRTPTQLYPATLRYQNKITFIPNTFDSKLFTSLAYTSQQESLSIKTGLIMDPSSITHHDTNGTMITFSGIRSYENTPYYSSTVSGFKRALKQDSIDGRMVGSMRFDASLNAYVNDEAYHMYPAIFSGFYDSIVTDYTDAYIFELKNDPNAPWLPQNPSTLIRLFGHGRTDMLFRLFQMTYAFIKYGFSTTTDTYMQNELYTWYLDNIVGYETSLLQSGQMFVLNDTNSVSFHPSIFNRTNTVIPIVNMDTLYVSLGK